MERRHPPSSFSTCFSKIPITLVVFLGAPGPYRARWKITTARPKQVRSQSFYNQSGESNVNAVTFTSIFVIWTQDVSRQDEMLFLFPYVSRMEKWSAPVSNIDSGVISTSKGLIASFRASYMYCSPYALSCHGHGGCHPYSPLGHTPYTSLPQWG